LLLSHRAAFEWQRQSSPTAAAADITTTTACQQRPTGWLYMRCCSRQQRVDCIRL